MNDAHAHEAHGRRLRCAWPGDNALLCAYHDGEWGVPEYDGRALWEKLMLDGFQAGLSWLTILRKRPAFREVFAGFEPDVVARFDERDVERLLADARIVRSRSKIEAVIGNARAWLAMESSGEAFAPFVWSFVGGEPVCGDGVHVPTATPVSAELSKALKQRGFKYVGPTIVYAWMQAVGMVNDHAEHCFRRDEVTREARPLR
ncbi:DNA-3-methyladenine glycosylase I [Salinisphaera sp. T31B1]|uniref:DNA-3-methyladenine glycosylase I n=1 Tax=Salinisphaera sp. T31B1 TaxID=727963 RepID=UPI003341911C